MGNEGDIQWPASVFNQGMQDWPSIPEVQVLILSTQVYHGIQNWHPVFQRSGGLWKRKHVEECQTMSNVNTKAVLHASPFYEAGCVFSGLWRRPRPWPRPISPMDPLRICLYETVPEMNAADRASGTRNTVVNTHSFSFDHVHLWVTVFSAGESQSDGLWWVVLKGVRSFKQFWITFTYLTYFHHNGRIWLTTMGGHPGIYHLSC